jgi:hypothetical protein
MLRLIASATSNTTIASSALVMAGALLAGSVVFLASVAPQAKADTLAASALLPVLAVNDRLPAKIADKIAKVACSSQNWPNYDRSCQFDLRQPDGAVVNVRVLDLGRQGSRI